jgi:Xaa-Pro dipeptidase
MKKGTIRIGLLLAIILFAGFNALAQEARARYDMMKIIRKEKLDLVLPGAMRDHNVDMWIHVMQDGHTDPLYLDLGVNLRLTVNDTTCFVVFTDLGEEKGIERAVIGGGRGDRELYSIWKPENDLGAFVAERDPKVIAVNMSVGIPSSNGMSHIGYLRLTERIGEKYTARLISAENLISDFRVRRVQTEVIAFANLAEMQRQLMEETYRKIVPGVTTYDELGWWVQDRVMEMGLGDGRVPEGPSAPSGRLSRNVYTRGDFLSWDWGLNYLNFGTDYKRYGYILKEGETDIPEGIKKLWNTGLKAREIYRKTIKIGYTAGEMRDMMIKAMEAEGFVYTPSDDYSDAYRKQMDKMGDSDKPGFYFDSHAVGNTGNSEIAEGASMAPFRDARNRFVIQQNHLFAFEFMVHIWNPDTKQRQSLNLEDNAIVTEKGVEALYPRNDEIIIIH